MKRHISITILIVFLFNCIAASGQYANLDFVENKGQWDKSIKFKGIMNNGSFFLTEKGFTVVQSKPEDLEKLASFYHGTSHVTPQNTAARSVIPDKDKSQITVHSYGYNVTFLNGQTPVISGDKPLNTYNNYIIGNDPSKWKGNCRIYQAITYQNIYPGIDIRYYTNEGKLTYDIIVHPGADLSRLAIRYDGADELKVKNEQLIIKTSVGETRELAPYAYQSVDGIKKEVGCRFQVAGNVVRFAMDGYLKSSELIIDPTLIFSTFTGSTADNWGYTATYGADGSFYAGGVVFNLEGNFPTSPGAFSTTFNGGVDDEEGIGPYDIGIMKFSPNGANRVYATYLGGNGNEQPHSLVVDAQGELVIAGRTTSTNYPTTVTDLKGGKYDIILTKLNTAGSALVGSRKIGGSGADGVNIRPKYPSTAIESIRRNYGDDARSEVILDNSGNIILASNTQSADFPTSAGAFQRTFAGKQDGVIIKTNPDLSNILFSSFLGGSGNDAAFVLAINPADNNLYIGGNTDGTDLPGDKANVLQPTSQGGETEGFVSIIDINRSALLKTTYIGTAGNDMLYGIQFDKFGSPYITGTTTSNNWPVINAAFSQSKGKQFIAKLRPDLSAYEYSTVFGSGAGNPNISPTAFLVDVCENVYVSGWGGEINTDRNYPNAGTAGLSVTPDAIQSSTDNSDFYFFVLERNAASQLYGSFFGQSGGRGEHVDGGTSRFDRNGVIYQALCANCGGEAAFPTTPGVWSPSNGSSNCNLAAVKIAFNLAGIISSIRASINGVIRDTSGCVPLTVDFTDTLAAGKQYRWNFGDGSPEVETAAPVISHTFNEVRTYRIRLISVDSAKCNIADTAYTNIKVKTDKVNLGFTPQKLPPCESANYQFTNTSYVAASSGTAFTNTSFTWYFGDNTPPVSAGSNTVTHAFPGVGMYTVKLVLTDTSFCNAPDSIEVPLRIAANLKAQFETPASGCAPYRAVFKNISEGGSQFYWDFGDGVTSTETSPEHVYAVPGTYMIKLRAVDSATCNITDTISITVAVGDNPTASYSFTPNPPQENTPVSFLNNSIAATNYKWEFGDGETATATSQEPISHIYNATGNYNSCLTAINNSGCRDTACQNIAALVLPLLDVPNAFTPNRDGINDKVFVRGYGISKITWKIYNRWGEKVFETNDKTQGWDGTFKGSLQPKEVYHYILSVQYIDNTKYDKKGDITLLR